MCIRGIKIGHAPFISEPGADVSYTDRETICPITWTETSKFLEITSSHLHDYFFAAANSFKDVIDNIHGYVVWDLVGIACNCRNVAKGEWREIGGWRLAVRRVVVDGWYGPETLSDDSSGNDMAVRHRRISGEVAIKNSLRERGIPDPR